MACREKIVEAANSLVGLGANPANQEKLAAYTELIAPIEPPALQAAMLKMSGCALTVAGIWRMVGVEHSLLSNPYKVGQAIARLITIAKDNNAWELFSKQARPGLGDSVLVGDNGAGGTEHIYTIVEVHPETDSFTTVDGGQRDGQGFQLILKKTRTWRSGRDVVFHGTDPGGATVGGRRIVGWINVEKLKTSNPEDIYEQVASTSS